MALTKLASTMVDVTVFVSPDVITVPVVLGKVIVLSDVVGSATVNVVSNASTVDPSNTMLPVLPINISPVTVPPASASFSVSNS